MALLKHELYSLASVGMRQQLLKMEKELATIHKEFPDLFSSPTPPHFVKLEAKSNGSNGGPATNGWPELRITPPESQTQAKQRARWTPERRAAQARRMKKQQAKLQAGRGKTRHKTAAPVTTRSTKPAQLPVWFRAYEFLLNAPDRTARLSDLVKTLKVKKSATIITGIDYHQDVIKRASPGVYQVVRDLSDEEIQQVRKSPKASAS